MADREKVIKGLISCAKWMKNNDTDACNSCPYHHHFSYDDNNCIAMVNSEAIELLKEQEAVKIEVKKINSSGRCGRCPNCLIELNEMDYPDYCGYCGQKVRWE